MTVAQTNSSTLSAREADEGSVPPLENGDRLTRAEFERRYEAMPDVKKAELIEGIVYMSSPVRHRGHGFQHVLLVGWLAHYMAATPGVDPSDNATLRLDDENQPQPDLLLRLPEAVGGRSRVDAKGYLEGPVEFVGEIAGSSVSLDMHAKLRSYLRHGIQEYLVWRMHDRAVDWFALRDGRYEPLKGDEQGILRGEVFPGLWLDVPSLLRGDLASVFLALDAGLATAAHKAFADRIKPATT